MYVFINENILKTGKFWEPQNREEFEANIKSLLDSLNCFHFFYNSEVYFNGSGINFLIEHLNLINDYNEYSLTNEIDQLRQMIIDLEAKDWTQNKLHKDSYNYLVQLGGGFNPFNVKGTSLAEATEYKYHGYKTVVINFSSSEFNTHAVIKVNRVNINPPEDMTLNNIPSICTKNDTIRYYLKNREAVAYNHNPKHGENHAVVKKKGGEIISPLKCKITEAAALLQISVGNKKSSKLFAYDFAKKEFIEFKYDNTDNPKGYHGYHPHNQKIPADVEKFINDNKENFNQLFEAL